MLLLRACGFNLFHESSSRYSGMFVEGLITAWEFQRCHSECRFLLRLQHCLDLKTVQGFLQDRFGMEVVCMEVTNTGLCRSNRLKTRASCAKAREYKHIEVSNNTDLDVERSLADPSRRSIVKLDAQRMIGRRFEILNEIRSYVVSLFVLLCMLTQTWDFETQRGLVPQRILESWAMKAW